MTAQTGNFLTNVAFIREDRYFLQQPLIIKLNGKPGLSQAPVQQVDGVPVPKLEKLLVDVFAEPVRLAAYQGAELGRVFSGAARQVPLVPATFWRYAQRRKRADALREWLGLRADEPALRELADWPAQR